MKALKYCAVAGALALVGSLGYAAPAAAVTSDHAVITNGTLVGDVYQMSDYLVEATVSGCPEGSMMKAFFYYDGPGLSGVVDEAGEFPGGTTQNVQFGAPVNGNYSVLVACTDYAGNYALNGETELTVPHGYINMTGPSGADTWRAGDPVTLSNGNVYDENAHNPLPLFQPGSAIDITVTGPDGKVSQFATTANPQGGFEYSMVLPYDVEGVYTVTVKGSRMDPQGNPLDVLLVDQYKPVGLNDKAPDPGKDNDKNKDNDKKGGKPSALPKTGSESWGLVPAAALISIVAGGAMVALRSRKR